MKRLLFFSVTLLSLSCVAQDQSKPVQPSVPIIQTFLDHVIKLKVNADGGYGYEVLFHGRILINQQLNPFNLSPKGLSSKEDALKIAQWQVRQLATGVPLPAITGQSLSSAIARQLNISLL